MPAIYSGMLEIVEGQSMIVHTKRGYNLVTLSTDYSEIIAKMTANEAEALAHALLSAAKVA